MRAWHPSIADGREVAVDAGRLWSLERLSRTIAADGRRQDEAERRPLVVRSMPDADGKPTPASADGRASPWLAKMPPGYWTAVLELETKNAASEPETAFCLIVTGKEEMTLSLAGLAVTYSPRA